MNRFLLFAVMLSAIPVYCLGRGPGDRETNADFIKIKAKLCDKNSKPTEEQWTAFLACKKPCNDTNHGDRHDKMKQAFDTCASKADDVNDLKTNNAEKDKYIIMLCSEKNKACLEDMRNQGKKDGGEKNDDHKPDDGDKSKSGGGGPPNREAMQNKMKDEFSCGSKALGLSK